MESGNGCCYRRDAKHEVERSLPSGKLAWRILPPIQRHAGRGSSSFLYSARKKPKAWRILTEIKLTMMKVAPVCYHILSSQSVCLWLISNTSGKFHHFLTWGFSSGDPVSFCLKQSSCFRGLLCSQDLLFTLFVCHGPRISYFLDFYSHSNEGMPQVTSLGAH